jgi:hypothetical protein
METGLLVVLTLVWAGLREIARVDTEMTRALYLAGSETPNAPSDRQVVLYHGRPLSSWRGRLALGVMGFNLRCWPRLSANFTFLLRDTWRPLLMPTPAAGTASAPRG